MSSPKFMVFKLKDLRIPFIILLVAIALLVFFLIRNKGATQTFAPSDTYQDGRYIAGIQLSDAEMDLVVEIKDSVITSVALEGLDESSSILYTALVKGIDEVNAFVTATQSLEFPTNAQISPATNMLMDAVKVALADDKNTQITSTYESLTLPVTEEALNVPMDPLNPGSESENNVSANVPVEPENQQAADSDVHTSIMEEQVIEQ